MQRKKKYRGQKKQGKNKDAAIEAPFNLVHRFKPLHMSQCYMMGMVDGKKEFVTNVTVNMSKDFSQIMQQLYREAQEGKFGTKGDAIRRRDELVGMTPAEPAESETASGVDVN